MVKILLCYLGSLLWGSMYGLDSPVQVLLPGATGQK